MRDRDRNRDTRSRVEKAMSAHDGADEFSTMSLRPKFEPVDIKPTQSFEAEAKPATEEEKVSALEMVRRALFRFIR